MSAPWLLLLLALSYWLILEVAAKWGLFGVIVLTLATLALQWVTGH